MTIQIWEELLRHLTLHQQKFLLQLTNEMSLAIIKPSSEDVSNDEYREAMVIWLEHIYNDKSWKTARKRGHLSDDVVLSTCLVNPGPWTLRLALAIIDHESHQKARTQVPG